MSFQLYYGNVRTPILLFSFTDKETKRQEKYQFLLVQDIYCDIRTLVTRTLRQEQGQNAAHLVCAHAVSSRRPAIPSSSQADRSLPLCWFSQDDLLPEKLHYVSEHCQYYVPFLTVKFQFLLITGIQTLLKSLNVLFLCLPYFTKS